MFYSFEALGGCLFLFFFKFKPRKTPSIRTNHLQDSNLLQTETLPSLIL